MMKWTRSVAVSAAALSIGIAPNVQAQLNGSNVELTASNGFVSSCKALDVFATVGAGPEAQGTDWTGGCVGQYAVDIGDNGFFLTVADAGNYTLATLAIHFISGPPITSAAFLGYSGNFFDLSHGHNQTNFNPQVTFDAQDVFVKWDTGGGDSGDPNDQFAFGDVGTGQALFSVNGSVVVGTPEPASLALTATGLVGIAGFARRRKKSTN